jgi:putative flippase GtrA
MSFLKEKHHNWNFIFIKQLMNRDNVLAQGARFVLVGISNTVIGLGIIFICYNLLHINYILSNVIGYSCGLTNSYIWNKRWTFRSAKNPTREIAFFLLFFAVSYGLNLASVVFCVRRMGFNPNVAQFFGIAVYTSTNFLTNKYVTFH